MLAKRIYKHLQIQNRQIISEFMWVLHGFSFSTKTKNRIKTVPPKLIFWRLLVSKCYLVIFKFLFLSPLGNYSLGVENMPKFFSCVLNIEEKTALEGKLTTQICQKFSTFPSNKTTLLYLSIAIYYFILICPENS